jgi:uncharacterized protein (DUF983 family)
MLDGMIPPVRGAAPVHPLLHTWTAKAPLTPAAIRLALGRGLRLKCPVCGVGRLFSSFWSMREECPHCGVSFRREEGFWLGSMDINLTLSLLLILGSLVFLPDLEVKRELAVLGGASVLLPAILFRFVRGFWMALLFLSGAVY